jgi:hypothetical protein
MALITLHPSAHIVVDLQKIIVGSSFIHPIGEVVNRACAPISAFREEAHDYSTRNVFARLSETRRSREIVDHRATWEI